METRDIMDIRAISGGPLSNIMGIRVTWNIMTVVVISVIRCIMAILGYLWPFGVSRDIMGYYGAPLWRLGLLGSIMAGYHSY